MSEPSIRDEYEGLFDDGPLDGSRLGRDIAGMGVNRRFRMYEFRDDLRRRVRARLSGDDPTYKEWGKKTVRFVLEIIG